MKLSVIIPTYNEKDNINILYNTIKKEISGIDYEIIFVDDSKDGTDEEIKKLADPNIILEHRIEKSGLSSAVIRGIELATGEIIAVMDADMQHPPYLLKLMYEEIVNGADICIPSRFIKGGSDGGLNIYRKLVSLVARKLAHIWLPNLRKISDITSGIFCFKKKNLLKNKTLNPIGWKILLEVLTKSKFETVVEISYKFQKRYANETKLNNKIIYDYLKQLPILKKEQYKNKYKVVRKNVNEQI